MVVIDWKEAEQAGLIDGGFPGTSLPAFRLDGESIMRMAFFLTMPMRRNDSNDGDHGKFVASETRARSAPMPRKNRGKMVMGWM